MPVGRMMGARIVGGEGSVPAGLAEQGRVREIRRVAEQFAVAVTADWARLIDANEDRHPIAAQFVPREAELSSAAEERADPIGDERWSPVPGIVHRYPDRVLLKPTLLCPVYCRFCFRREVVGKKAGMLGREALQRAYDYIRQRPQLWEVIVTGGDPFILTPRRLADIVSALDQIPHLGVIRFHTRVPVVDPGRPAPGAIAARRRVRLVPADLCAGYSGRLRQSADRALRGDAGRRLRRVAGRRRRGCAASLPARPRATGRVREAVATAPDDPLMIVVGGGAIALSTAQELCALQEHRVVVLWRRAPAFARAVEGIGAVYIAARPDSVEGLDRAGVNRAVTILALSPDDQLNLHTALLARDVNPRIRIVLRQFNRTLAHKIEQNLPDCSVLSLAWHSAATYPAPPIHPFSFPPLQFPQPSLHPIPARLPQAALASFRAAICHFYAVSGGAWHGSVYFLVTTMTTTGYGDLPPRRSEPIEVVAAMLLMLSGITLTGLFIAFGAS